MDWNVVDERLIRRGELLLSLDFLDVYNEELNALNQGKVGRPFTLTDSHVKFLSIIRYVFAMPYRQLEGFNRALCSLVPGIPSADYSGLRRRIMRLDMSLFVKKRISEESIVLAIDSSRVRVHKAGGWVERKHSRKRRYIKIHFAVNVETAEVVATEVTTDDTHDSKVFPILLEKTDQNGKVSKVIGDGAYDSSEIYELLESRGIEGTIKPRKNSRSDTPSEARKAAVKMYRLLGHKRWTKLKGTESDGALRQHTLHSNAYSESSAWQRP